MKLSYPITLLILLCAFAQAQVLVSDSGVTIIDIRPGAPKHTVGLKGHRQAITLDTGAKTYSLRYVVALDPDDPKKAIPGEGYIGMPEPVDCNWYGGGFFDLQLNGKTIGGTFIHSLTGRSSGDRGTADFVFDADAALVRVRFVALAGGDCLYAQVFLEPKEEITSVRLVTRCYPSGWITDSERHVGTATRDFKQGERADLDVAKEYWTLYYDILYDAGFAGANRTGVGPCAMLWLPEQTKKVGFSVGSYGIDTALDLDPAKRDFRFIFFDYAGTKNAAARANLLQGGAALRDRLAELEFTDPALANWSLAEKQVQAREALGSLPPDHEIARKYDEWGRQLAEQLPLMRSGGKGAIVAEANCAKVIAEWERGLPEIALRALLNEI